MEINFSSRECNVKIVYYGPGLSGKTTNLEIIHEKTPAENRGKLTALATDLDRTLFFDYMPLELGKIGGLTIRLRLFTVPGQVYYNATRKLVLRCVDGVVFVADSQESQRDANLESLQNLEENLAEHGMDLHKMPLVLQFNKRDLPNIMSLERMEELLNKTLHAPCFPAVAIEGNGVSQCLKSIANLTMVRVEESIRNKSAAQPKEHRPTPLAKPGHQRPGVSTQGPSNPIYGQQQQASQISKQGPAVPLITRPSVGVAKYNPPASASKGNSPTPPPPLIQPKKGSLFPERAMKSQDSAVGSGTVGLEKKRVFHTEQRSSSAKVGEESAKFKETGLQPSEEGPRFSLGYRGNLSKEGQRINSQDSGIVGSSSQQLIGKAPIGQNPIGKIFPGQNPIGQHSVGQNPTAQTPIGQHSVGHPIGQHSVGHPIGQHSVEKKPIGQHSVGQNPTVQTPIGQHSVGQNPTVQTPIGQHSVGQNPTAQTPIGQKPKVALFRGTLSSAPSTTPPIVPSAGKFAVTYPSTTTGREEELPEIFRKKITR